MAMNRLTAGMVVVAALALAGCGGGTDGHGETARNDEAGATNEATVQALRTRLKVEGMRAESIAPEKAAEQLLDFAESRFPMYFPIHATTQTLAPFRFRAYPGDIYLGVATSSEGGHIANGVYVMGGPFGSQPIYVGLLTDFIAPVDPDVPVGPTGPGNGCGDLSAAEAVGHSMVVTMQNTGSSPGTTTTESRNLGLTTFEGHQAMESVNKTITETQVEGRTARYESETRFYGRRTGESEVTEYGYVTPPQAASLDIPFASNGSRVIYTPPFVNRVAALAPGESLTQTRFGTLISAIQHPGFPTTESRMPMNFTATTTFVGVETITVPAGTFTACKFQLSVPGERSSTSWQHRGTGAGLKFEGPHGSSVATSVIVNGVTLGK